jgi:hypothetical protein
MPAPTQSLRPQARPEVQSQTGQATGNTTAGGPGNAALQDILNDRTERVRAVGVIQTWLDGQKAALDGLEGQAKVTRAEAVLSTLETVWSQLLNGENIDNLQLPTAPTTINAEAPGVVMPPELIGEIRPIITMLDAGVAGAATDTSGGPEASAHNGTDWNTRLSVPEYRTQSDNLVGPEATCNVTTMAMVMERLGIGREDVVEALEERIKKKWIAGAKRAGTITAARAKELEANLDLVDEEEGWDRDAEWKKAARRYLDAKMLDKSYQRVRGESSVSNAKRDEVAGQMRGNAQMEDLLDMLSHETGLSRYGIVGEPDKILEMVSNTGLPAEGEDKIWGGASWKDIRDKTRTVLEAGGAAALSFKHKGTRDRGASHIVSVQEVRDDGFVIDDPYGIIRSTYDRNAYDDAYFSSETYQQRTRSGGTVTKEKVIHDRSARKNTQHGFDDWGVGAARTLDADESKGRDSFMSKSQITTAMYYITLFQRGKRVPLPKPRPANLGQ